MYFSSLLFLFLFLPAVLVIYYILPRKLRNGFLLLSDLVFYGWGEPVFILIMPASILTNYVCGILIDKNRTDEHLAKVFAVLSVIISLGLLCAFKYTGFLCDVLRHIPLFSWLPEINIALPIGISFYTFQTMSYTIDVYRGDTRVQRNLIDFSTYVSFFPQLIAGPIVRYKDISYQLNGRRETTRKFALGVSRFCAGLAKKVLIANQMGLLWDSLRDMGAANGIFGAWMGIAAFSLQIYFDFSGYSDMAIGLGKMFGFEFAENFNYPYISKSVTEFWRRWHMSLSGWFRDYVYIPLGGNRRGISRHIFNLFVVWALTGFWHGANLNFILWGIYYFVLLVLEKYVYGRALDRLPRIFGHIYSLFFIILGWTLFYFEDFGALLEYIGYMFNASNGFIGHDALVTVISYAPVVFVSILACLPFWKRLFEKNKDKKIIGAAQTVLCLIALVMCTMALTSESYNPFLYFRF